MVLLHALHHAIKGRGGTTHGDLVRFKWVHRSATIFVPLHGSGTGDLRVTTLLFALVIRSQRHLSLINNFG